MVWILNRRLDILNCIISPTKKEEGRKKKKEGRQPTMSTNWHSLPYIRKHDTRRATHAYTYVTDTQCYRYKYTHTHTHTRTHIPRLWRGGPLRGRIEAGLFFSDRGRSRVDLSEWRFFVIISRKLTFSGGGRT